MIILSPERNSADCAVFATKVAKCKQSSTLTSIQNNESTYLY
jgi:hypothetical protein